MSDEETITPKEAAKAASAGPVDRVAMASRFADGSPSQGPAGYEYINPEFAEAATTRQLHEQRVSNVDQALRPKLGLSGSEDQGNDRDPNVQKLKDAHDAAGASAASDAKAEVKANS